MFVSRSRPRRHDAQPGEGSLVLAAVCGLAMVALHVVMVVVAAVNVSVAVVVGRAGSVHPTGPPLAATPSGQRWRAAVALAWRGVALLGFALGVAVLSAAAGHHEAYAYPAPAAHGATVPARPAPAVKTAPAPKVSSCGPCRAPAGWKPSSQTTTQRQTTQTPTKKVSSCGPCLAPKGWKPSSQTTTQRQATQTPTKKGSSCGPCLAPKGWKPSSQTQTPTKKVSSCGPCLAPKGWKPPSQTQTPTKKVSSCGPCLAPKGWKPPSQTQTPTKKVSSCGPCLAPMGWKPSSQTQTPTKKVSTCGPCLAPKGWKPSSQTQTPTKKVSSCGPCLAPKGWKPSSQTVFTSLFTSSVQQGSTNRKQPGVCGPCLAPAGWVPPSKRSTIQLTGGVNFSLANNGKKGKQPPIPPFPPVDPFANSNSPLTRTKGSTPTWVIGPGGVLIQTPGQQLNLGGGTISANPGPKSISIRQGVGSGIDLKKLLAAALIIKAIQDLNNVNQALQAAKDLQNHGAVGSVAITGGSLTGGKNQTNSSVTVAGGVVTGGNKTVTGGTKNNTRGVVTNGSVTVTGGTRTVTGGAKSTTRTGGVVVGGSRAVTTGSHASSVTTTVTLPHHTTFPKTGHGGAVVLPGPSTVSPPQVRATNSGGHIRVVIPTVLPGGATITLPGHQGIANNGPGGITILQQQQGAPKRGDHVFANGLAQQLSGTSGEVARQLGGTPEGATLSAALARAQAVLNSSVYQITVNKGQPPGGFDAQANRFGQSSAAFSAAMQAYIFALAQRRLPIQNPGDVAARQQAVSNAAMVVQLRLNDWLNAAFDGQAANLASGQRAQIQQGIAGLQQIRQIIEVALRRL
jgi:hypothetical protein